MFMSQPLRQLDWPAIADQPDAVRVSDDARPGVVVAPMGWWNVDYPQGRSAQATTSQALTELGRAPTFNDNRVEVEPVT